MSQIKAQIVADSKNPQGDRLTTMLITFPRFILAELNTHRMLSKNSASSRAIPFKKMVESVQNNPFIPIAWQKEHKGMQGDEYFFGDNRIIEEQWLEGRDAAIQIAERLNKGGITKQLCNRLLEPFMMHTVLISGTEWENFFALRCPQYEIAGKIYRSKKDVYKDYPLHSVSGILEPDDYNWFKLNKGQAEIHMMALAEAMWDAMNESIPKELKAGEWHIPFNEHIDKNVFTDTFNIGENKITWVPIPGIDNGADNWRNLQKVKISTAMAARTSYTVVGDEKEFTYEQQIALHDRMANQVPFHASPFEHCAKAMDENEYMCCTKTRYNPEKDSDHDIESGWCRNYRGFIQYREILEN